MAESAASRRSSDSDDDGSQDSLDSSSSSEQMEGILNHAVNVSLSVENIYTMVICFCISSGLSKKRLPFLLSLMNAASTDRGALHLHASHCMKRWESLLQPFELESQFICPGCFSPLLMERSRCSTAACRYHNLRLGRQTNVPIEVVTASCIAQLKAIAIRELPAIRATLQACAEKMCDIPSFPFYKKAVGENPSVEEGVEVITISAILNFDGISLFKNSKRKFQIGWLTLVELGSGRRIKFNNAVLVAAFSGASEPRDRLDLILERFVREVELLERQPIEIEDRISGKKVLLKLKLLYIAADTPARLMLMKHTAWNGRHSCLHCTLSGIKVKTRTLFIPPDHQAYTGPPVMQRSAPEYLEQSKIVDEAHRSGDKAFVLFGSRGVSPLQRVIDGPHVAIPDGFHAENEGVCKSIRDDFLGLADGKRKVAAEATEENFQPMQLTPTVIAKMSKCMAAIRFPKSWPRVLMPLSSVKQWSGTDLFNWCLFLMPTLFALYLPAEKSDAFAFYLIFLKAVRLQRQKVFEPMMFDQHCALTRLFRLLTSQIIGMSRHTYVWHQVGSHSSDCFRQFGSSADITTSMFESWLHQLRLQLPKHSTRQTCLQVVQRICGQRASLEQLGQAYADTGNASLLQFLHDHKSAVRAPIGLLCDGVHLCDPVPSAQLDAQLRAFVLESFDEPIVFKRLFLDGNEYGSHFYDEMRQMQCSIVKMVVDGNFVAGEVQAIVQHEDESRVSIVIRRFHRTFPIFQFLKFKNATVKEMYGTCSLPATELQQRLPLPEFEWFGRMDEHFRIYRAKDIIGNGILVEVPEDVDEDRCGQQSCIFIDCVNRVTHE